jgi:two-component system, chemotaxis family, sensor kinase CheA
MVDISKFKDLFLSEAEDHIALLNKNLLAFEKDSSNKGLLTELMRSSHTLKSSSATMGHKQMSFLTHVLEDVFDYGRNGMLEITPEIMQVAFKAVDQLEKSARSVKTDDKELDVQEIINELKEVAGVETSGTGRSQRDASGKPIQEAKKNEEPKSDDELSKKVEEPKVAPASVETIEKISHIKVPVERLDALMDLMEELLIDKMQLQNIVDRFKDGEVQESVQLRQELRVLSEHLARLVSDIQYQVMQSRLVPVDQIFARFPRLVRDIAKEQKKTIQFDLVGGEIELDRTIVDQLGAPLVHLIKNAVDHGVGEKGIVKVTARREQEFALISVEDDGGGIQWDQVVSAAVKRGLVPGERAGSLTRKEQEALLFAGRVSTKDHVTETSGRGVGVSVVKQFVEVLGGRLGIESPTQSGGTRFTMELPLTLAIVNSLLIRSAGSLFALPFSSIDRSVHVPADNIKRMADHEIAIIDGKDVPLVRLAHIFGVAESEEDVKEKVVSANGETVVIIERGDDVAGIVVDQLEDELEIIVKPLSPVLRKIKGFSGSTILGDGRTVLILDVVGLLESRKA